MLQVVPTRYVIDELCLQSGKNNHIQLNGVLRQVLVVTLVVIK